MFNSAHDHPIGFEACASLLLVVLQNEFAHAVTRQLSYRSQIILLLVTTFTSTSQPLAADSETHPNHHNNSENAYIDPVLVLQPSLSQPGYYGHQHDEQAQASGSTSHQTHLLPPANVPIDYDINFYDPSTNPYAAVAVAPMPWHIPSYPQVQIPLYLLGYDQQPANHQLYGNIDPPMFMCPPGDQVPETHDVVADVDPTPTVHSHIVSVQPRYPSSNMSTFLPEFKLPILSMDGDVLLPPGVEDKGFREPVPVALLPSDVKDKSLEEPIAGAENHEDEMMFRHYRGPSDRRGRKRGVKHSTRPELLFNDKNKVHQRIVRSAKKEITKHALNIAALTEEGDRATLVDKKLEEAAKSIIGEKEGTAWASHNSGLLYMMLSEPCKTIMQTCRKHASNLVLDGFDLRLSIWSEASESTHQEAILEDLLDDQIFPPKFLMELGTDNEWHFRENKVVLNVILDSVRELKLSRYLEEVNSIACAAAVTVCCALERVKYKISADVEFTGAAFKELYNKLMHYIEVTIKNSPKLRERWEHFKECIKARLAQYL
ncbi:hypothetical protein C8R48DRAFT_678314 [Suillus tomentosus]|nr:hypothetical protein C8R48DRAFT_678314 [Suillus tomentosus]